MGLFIQHNARGAQTLRGKTAADEFLLGAPDHVAFSRSSHDGIGAPLARMEVRVALEQFLARTSDIRISEAQHGPPGTRRYAYKPT